MLDTQMIHRDSYTPKKTRWMRRLLTIALLVTICSASVSYIPFDLYTHGNIDWAISLISNLYLQGNIGVSTFIWYGVMLLLLWLAWTKSEKMQDSFDRAVWRVSCIVLFLSPSVFISPPP